MSLFDNADKLVELRERKRELESLIKEINVEIQETEKILIQEMVEEEMQNFTRNSRQFILTRKTYAGAKSGMMPAICLWMKNNGLGDMVKESVHPQTLQVWVRETIEEDGILAEGLDELINVYEQPGITVRRK